jgi:23S rRNA (uracil1939-C5)-methyltransferase
MRSPEGRVKAGYFRKGSHKLVNLNQCPVQDERLDPLLAEVKQDIQDSGLVEYTTRSVTRGGCVISACRVGRRTGRNAANPGIYRPELWKIIELQAQEWMERYEALVGVCVNLNPQPKPTPSLGIGDPDWLKASLIPGRSLCRPAVSHCIPPPSSRSTLSRPRGWPGGLWMMQLQLLKASETIVDAYCGVGSFDPTPGPKGPPCELGWRCSPRQSSRAWRMPD